MFRLEITTDNAAFEGDNLAAEVAAILRKAADSIEGYGLTSGAHIVRDINGNRVGSYGLREASNLESAARAIIRARDHFSEHGRYDQGGFGPDADQQFDDWAADILETALGGKARAVEAFTFEAQGDETVIYATADDSAAALVRVAFTADETFEEHCAKVRAIVAAMNARAAGSAAR